MKIAFNGHKGAYAELAILSKYPYGETLPCKNFADAFDAVKSGAADLAMIPIENSSAGRVADVHALLPMSGLHIIDEHFQPINHCLLASKSANKNSVKMVMSHPQALAQCRTHIQNMNLEEMATTSTSSGAEAIQNDPSKAAIASSLCADLYDLQILEEHFEDASNNTTRFIVVSKDACEMDITLPTITTLFFELRSVPAALYKALGGFATNNINLTKIESYVGADDHFNSAKFYVEAEAHKDSPEMKRVLEELGFFANDVKILGSYPKNQYRENT